MKPPKGAVIYWLTWLAVGFGAVEAWALISGNYDWTLSAVVQWGLGAGEENREWYNWIGRIGFVGLVAWLVPHWLNRWKWFK